MDREEMLVSLAGQVVNGIMSSNSSVLSKVLEASMYDQIAEVSVKIAEKMADEIEKSKSDGNNQHMEGWWLR